MSSTDSKNAGTRGEGKAKPFAEGHRSGRSEVLRRSIHDLCEVLAIELTAGREHLERDRRWPPAGTRAL